MNKQTFMRELADGLNRLPKAEADDILLDIEEYFTCAAQEGLNEQEMCERLGDPKKLAKEYSVQRYIERAQQDRSVKNTARAILSTAGLGIIDFLYVVFVVVSGYIVLSALYVAACSIGLAGLAGITFSVVNYGIVGMFAGWAGIFGGGFLTALGVLFFIGLMQLGKLFRKGNMLFLNSISERIKGGKKNE